MAANPYGLARDESPELGAVVPREPERQLPCSWMVINEMDYLSSSYYESDESREDPFMPDKA